MVTFAGSNKLGAMKKSLDLSPFHKATGVALVLSLSALGGTWARAADAPASTSTNPSSSVSATSNNTGTAGSTAARDRHDTIHSDESRLNTVGRGVDASATKLSHGDRRFIEKAAKSGLAEVRVARLAVERAADPRVRSFAQQLVSDHERANAELSELAGRKGVSLPQDENDRHFKNLSDKNGAEFDQRFVGYMSDEHEDDIDLFEKASRKSDDPEVAAFASKQLPALQDHRRMAQDMEKSLKR